MKETAKPLRIFNFSHPLLNTEAFSVLGDKYSRTLPFKWIMTNDYGSSDVVLWDGVITPKNRDYAEKIMSDVTSSKVLLLIGESMTLLKNHPVVKVINPEGMKYVELAGWSVLPEEILNALQMCHQKLNHV